MLRPALTVCLIGLALGLCAVDAQDTPPHQRKLSSSDAAKVAELGDRQEALWKEDKIAEALTVAREIQSLRSRVQGTTHWETINAMRKAELLEKILDWPAKDRMELGSALDATNQCLVLLKNRQYEEAEKISRQAVAVFRRLLGDESPHTARVLHNLALVLGHQRKYAEAERLYKEALALHKRHGAADHPDAADNWSNLATELREQRRLPEAMDCFQRSLTIRRAAYGEFHAQTAEDTFKIASIQRTEGKLAEAEPGFRQALKIRRQVLGEEHPQTIVAFNWLAMNLEEQGKNAEAEAVFLQALAVRRHALGDEHPWTATIYHNLGNNLGKQGRQAEAEPLHRRALAITRTNRGDDHPEVAGCLSSLSLSLSYQGKLSEAEDCLHRALAIDTRTQGPLSLPVAQQSHNLGIVLSRQGRHAEAEPLLRTAFKVRREQLGDSHGYTVTTICFLAALLDALGRFVEAEPLHAEARQRCGQAWGEDHPTTSICYRLSAEHYAARGDTVQAEQLLTQAARQFERSRLHVAYTGLGRAGFGARNSPWPLLATLRAKNKKPGEAWQALEASLARGLFDDLAARRTRSLTADEQGREEQLIQEIDHLGKQITALVERKNSTEAQRGEEARLRRQRDDLQVTLSNLEAELVKQHGPAAGDVYDLARIQAALPEQAALLAWVDHSGEKHEAHSVREHWACVVRARGAPVWIALPGTGPGGVWTEADDDLSGQVRKLLADRAQTGTPWHELAGRLYRQRLAPIAAALAARDGLSPVQHLIILPSPALAGIPIEVLIESRPAGASAFNVNYAPSGTMLAYLKEKRRAIAAPLTMRPQRLLALGDPVCPQPSEPKSPPTPPDHGVVVSSVDLTQTAKGSSFRPGDVVLRYGDRRVESADDVPETPGEGQMQVQVWRSGQLLEFREKTGLPGVTFSKRSPIEVVKERYAIDALTRAASGARFTPLPGTRREVEAIALHFSDAVKLLGADASAARLEAVVPKLHEFDVLHLATHGVMDTTVALNSALVLSPPGDAGAPAQQSDRLTAEEMRKHWRLRARLVTLSACETGLGRASGGEGYLGFSQVLFLAGAESLLLSQWQVSDTATSLLMARFYENWLGTRRAELRERPESSRMSKAEALKEAKHWLRNLARAEAEKRLANLPEAARGLKLESIGSATPQAADRPFAHPYYWSAFILVGDPD